MLKSKKNSQPKLVSLESRNNRYKHKSAIVWFTGLSGAGKSTLAYAVEQRLFELGYNVITLDGDETRCGLCSDLGFSNEDRTENVRRIGEVSRLFYDTGAIVLAAFVSPIEADRVKLKTKFENENFFEIYCNCSIDVCSLRDVKGLYSKAKNGLITNFTGVSSVYEVPVTPDLIIDTSKSTIETGVADVVALLVKHKIISE